MEGWHWSYRSLPELADLPKEDQKRVWRAAWRRYLRSRYMWISMAAYMLMAMGPTLAGFNSMGSWFASMGVAAVLSTPLEIYFIRSFVHSELPKHCRSCGYDLRAAESVACPECGATGEARNGSAIEARDGSAVEEPDVRWGVILLGVLLGCCALALIWGIAQLFHV